MKTEEEIRNEIREIKEKKDFARIHGSADSYFIYKDLEAILKWVLEEIDNE